MTNYNERLDEILDKFGWTCVADGGDGYGLQNEDISEAKQALTSLTKELVEEAKPEKRTPDYYSDSIDLYSRQCAANSWNKAIDQFEQNLLKALEEV
jgi:hypothetical protein